MLKILTVIGARPQFIKAAVVSRAIREHNRLVTSHESRVTEVIVHTGQHYDDNMSKIFFEEMDIPTPDYNLNINAVSHGAMTGRMLEEIEKVLLKEKPDVVLVYGDTNSTLAGALAASKLHIPVAHVEAGLRSFNMKMPEEVNRVIADHLSSVLFVPTKLAYSNLLKEGLSEHKIQLVGDVMFDAVLFYKNKMTNRKDYMVSLGLKSKSYILVTIHRAENTDDPIRLRAIFDALIKVARTKDVVLPLHPRTKKILQKNNFYEEACKYIKIIEPIGYFEMLALEKEASLVVSDSGGVPKEAYFHKVPSVILRKEAVWEELIENGWAKAIDPVDKHEIYEVIMNSVDNLSVWNENLYGDGNASGKIVESLLSIIKI